MEEIYHVYNRSIAEYKIFNNNDEYLRMLGAIDYYRPEKPSVKFSEYIDSHRPHLVGGVGGMEPTPPTRWGRGGDLVDIIAYCLMPTHLHLILKEIRGGGISAYVSKILNSYTRYFNIRHRRRGPLWESRTKRVAVTTDDQFLHLTRYIHLNPVTAELVKKPEDWAYSSYREYINEGGGAKQICKFAGLIDMSPAEYKRFVNEQIPYQKELAKIKRLALD